MSALEICSLILLFFGNILTICCVALPYWKVNDPEDTVRDTVVRHEGLWMHCISLATGNWDCDDFNRFFLGLPSSLQAARGMSVTSIAFGILSLFLLPVGMESAPFGDDKSVKLSARRSAITEEYEVKTPPQVIDKSWQRLEDHKRRTRIVVGIFAFLAAALIIAPVSWFANDVRIDHELQSQDFRVRQFGNNSRFRDVFGASLFLGWTGGFLLLLASLLALCTVCGPNEEEEFNRGYAYKVSGKTSQITQEYV